MLKFITKLLDTNQKELDRLKKMIDEVNKLEPNSKKLKIKDFSKKTEEFKKRITDGETLESLIPESFSLVREAAVRTLGQRPFDVQLMAAIALFEGKVAEQKTGEGKTLSAVPALYLRALTGKGVHLVTVNDYLARLGAGWNGPVFQLLGFSTGVIVQENKSFLYDPEFNDSSHGDERLAHLKSADRKDVYRADITYGTNNEFGFDYLRDNMVSFPDQMVQRGHYFAIVDEVDSVLIDEARTPLIISAPDMEPTDKYFKFADIVMKLNSDTDYKVDEKSKTATLTEHGITKVEKILGVDNLYEKDYESIHHIENALRARSLYLKNKDYIVKDNQVIIVDEFTGRLMFGRRWSDGLHQAVEAKEGVAIQRESKTLATISFQNYFRMYEHLSGMTGTAATEADEFKKIYNLDVVVIPTNKPMVRRDMQDTIYKTLRAKYGAIIAEIQKRHEERQPVLVGTTSIEKNEIIADYLKKKKIPHNVLNAKNHEREATIIAEAGNPGAVTVATNMAGRGVDIVLGGALPIRGPEASQKDYEATKEYIKWRSDHEKVINAGGLHVIGTERHESRRIDNQLRGRSGRQGDPGSSQFYLSLEDDLMRIFGGDQIRGIMDRLNLPEDQPIENRLISRAIEQAQVKVEGFHFDIRKRLVEFDDVANQQRDIVYKLRRKVLEADSLKEEAMDKLSTQVEKILLATFGEIEGKPDYEKMVVLLTEIVPFDDESRKRIESNIKNLSTKDEIRGFMLKVIEDIHQTREKQVSEKVMRQIEKYAYLGAIDHMWIEHIDRIDDLREGINLRAYGQKDPLVEFKNEAYGLFEGLLERIDDELTRRVFRISVAVPQREIPLEQARINVDSSDMTGLAGGADVAAAVGSPVFGKSSDTDQQLSGASRSKIGRNDPCWCGSGKKWKKCHYPQYG
ncbi:preprotein translocase subunit SecA [Candidatus Woesebacteria bacterium RIFCSPLOWO2_01_FULL_39_21]|uniref:Protein translocase subunit SecA n=1 Tax=Candidatus Woesebacteria bacterium RIFCSPLOWO2_01_FULL_39_21 TaxID=1802519 RepID=A0A1F8BB64_9BACT|nr:MAG: preprotein translocase subunit SecA [Candidatus Woesebacteria bacterium RIFCSPHIGHO2_01_FULL_39_23]OGM61180.1 MAG: preprotein translocase subunit SecA [Candidatus Woesebacteria bacterium RIFCSPLOWO2_01_FULL_39_21]